MTDAAPPEKPRSKLTPERFAVESRRLDRALVVVVLVLAFFAGSFAATNSELWLHLATGRLIAEGNYQDGHDPFAFTTQQRGVVWINHSWLADWLLYVLAQAGGGPESTVGGAMLVIAKALLITLLAGLLLAIRRPVHGAWLPAICTLLAVVAMMPGLELQPVCLSYLFLGLTLYVLWHPPVARLEWLFRWTDGRPWLLLPLLFVLWVNVDRWFFLGPAVVALFLVGQWLPAGNDIGPTARRRLPVILVLGVLACLLSPNALHAFRLPAEYFDLDLAAILKTDPGLRTLYLAAYDRGYFLPGGQFNAAALAHWVLLVLGVISFLLLGRTAGEAPQPWWRYLVWGPLALLSLYYARLAPFFAVVAGPITALNLEDAAGRLAGTPETERGRRLALLGRSLTLLAGLGLLFAAWPGWLQPFAADPRHSRHVAWKVEVEPSLKSYCQSIAGEPGGLRDWFNATSDVANYFCWFAPGNRFFCDQRFDLYPRDVLADYVAVRQKFYPLAAGAGQTPMADADWNARLARYGATDFTLHGDAFPLDQAAMRKLLDDPHWALVATDGRTSHFARAVEPGRRPGLWMQKMEQETFGPRASRAPASGPGQPPQPPSFWQLYRQGPWLRPPQADEAAVDLLLFDFLGRQAGQRQALKSRLTFFGSVIASGTLTPGPVQAAFQVDVSSRLLPVLFQGPDLGPPALPLLAVRAARRAIAAEPDAAAGYRQLVDAYQVLWHRQENHWARTPPPVIRRPAEVLAMQRRQRQATDQTQFVLHIQPPGYRQMLRLVQVVAALTDLQKWPAEAETAHRMLAEVFWQQGFFDLTLTHLEALVAEARRRGQRPGETEEQFSKRLAEVEKSLQELQKDIAELSDDFDHATAQMPPGHRAGLAALGYGLPGRALTLLGEADPAQLSPDDRDLWLLLALMTGHTRELEGVMTGNLRTALGYRFDWYQSLLSAANGDYRAAARALDNVLMELGKIGPSQDRLRAEFELIRGLLALEEGLPAEAAEHLEQALRRAWPRYPVGAWLLPGMAPTVLPALTSLTMALHLPLPNPLEGRPIARRYLELIQKASGGHQPP